MRAACVCLSVALTLVTATTASAAVIYSYEAQAPPSSAGRPRAVTPSVSKTHANSRATTPRAPSGPPLGSAERSGGGEEAAGVPSAEGDQLVENGLSSPLCKGASRGLLSSAAQNNCQTSGFVGAPAPTNNYALDVHIDVGALGLSKGELLSVIQDVFVAPIWNATVWITHALVVMLEWCYTLELLGGSTMSGLARSLRQAQAGFTEPWLALALAVASILALYNGLIRRRVAETLGQVLLTIAMMAAGLWVIADPLGTVGAIGRWANQASLGTLATVAQGAPSSAQRTLGDSMRAVFSTAIEMPWCYLEFGNVRWCSDQALLEPRLRKAAGLLAAGQAKSTCTAGTPRPCAPSSGRSASTMRNAEALVSEAHTNGELFLAFPANGPERNSVKESGSLLRVLCRAEDDTKCVGATSAEAEFRSDGGTFPRMIGVVLIAIGALGMALLFGLLAMHLLAAAVASLFMLLLAPFAVLAPALGDGGRAMFGGWATRLLGAVTSKLIFSFVLGAVLTTQRILMSLQPLGWWTQWLLISAFWWAVFLKRHQAVAFLHNRRGGHATPVRRSVARRVEGALETPRAMLRPALWAKRKLHSPTTAEERTSEPRGPGGDQGSGSVFASTSHLRGHSGALGDRGEDTARGRVGERPFRHAGARGDDVAGRAQLGDSLAGRAQLKRLRDAREAALAGGDARRAAKLLVRSRRVEAETARPERSQDQLPGPRDLGLSPPLRGRPGKQYPPPSSQSALQFHESNVPAVIERREYLASPKARQEGPAGPIPTEASARYAGTYGHDRELDPARDLPERDFPERDFPARELPGGATPQGAPTQPKSRIMDDARAVAEGRKRQLGYGPQR